MSPARALQAIIRARRIGARCETWIADSHQRTASAWLRSVKCAIASARWAFRSRNPAGSVAAQVGRALPPRGPGRRRNTPVRDRRSCFETAARRSTVCRAMEEVGRSRLIECDRRDRRAVICSINPHLRACRARAQASPRWSPPAGACGSPRKLPRCLPPCRLAPARPS